MSIQGSAAFASVRALHAVEVNIQAVLHRRLTVCKISGKGRLRCNSRLRSSQLYPQHLHLQLSQQSDTLRASHGLEHSTLRPKTTYAEACHTKRSISSDQIQSHVEKRSSFSSKTLPAQHPDSTRDQHQCTLHGGSKIQIWGSTIAITVMSS